MELWPPEYGQSILVLVPFPGLLLPRTLHTTGAITHNVRGSINLVAFLELRDATDSTTPETSQLGMKGSRRGMKSFRLPAPAFFDGIHGCGMDFYEDFTGTRG